MSKPVKELLRKDLLGRLEGVTSLAIVDFTGIDAPMTAHIRAELKACDVKISVVKNSIARSVFDTVGLSAGKDLLDGPCALAWGGESVVSVVRRLLELAKEAESLTVKGALLEGEVFGADKIADLSKFPTRDEAIANVAGTLIGPARTLVGCLAGPAAQLSGALKTLVDKQESQQEEAA